MSRSPYDDWARDSRTLIEIGQVFDDQPLQVEVTLPRTLITQAIAAWQREEVTDVDLSQESPEERRMRHRAGSLGLIGLELSNQEVVADGDPVAVRLRRT